MSDIQFIGAGMWRTGTSSLQSAISQLTNKRCYKMYDVMMSSSKTKQWLDIIDGKQPDWPELLKGYGFVLDWPTLAYYKELSEFYPKAYVILSIRDPESWWQSISNTVLVSTPTIDTARTDWDKLILELFHKFFVGRNPTKKQAIDFYNRHNDEVEKVIPKDRLIVWHINDGWKPLCQALKLGIPSNSFPHISRTAEYRRLNRLR